VLSRSVVVDAATVYDGVADLGALANGALVQVSGAADAAGTLHATRVLRVQGTVGPADPVRIKGRVAGVAAGTFTIGSQVVTYTLGQTVFDNLSPAELSSSDTRLIEVTGTLAGGVVSATRVERVDGLAGAAVGERLYLRGFVVSGDATSFLVSTPNGPVTVQATGAGFKNGSAATIQAGQELEVTGTLSGSLVQATLVEFELANTINLEGDVQGIDLAAKTLTVDGVGITVTEQTLFKDSSLARVRGLNLAGLAVGNHLKIGGTLDRSVTPARVVATKLERFDPSTVAFLQGPVGALTPQLLILGVPVAVSGGTVYRQGTTDLGSYGAFSALVTLNTTVVRAKGSFLSGQLQAEEVVIE